VFLGILFRIGYKQRATDILYFEGANPAGIAGFENDEEPEYGSGRRLLNAWDRLFWTALRQCWPRWTDVLVLVKPDTVIGWHRAGFRLYWRWRSRPLGGRPKIAEEIRVLIRRLAQENQD